MDRAARLEQWYRRVYLEGDLDAVGTLFTPDLQEQGLLPGLAVTPGDLSVFAQAMMHLVDEPSFRLAKVIESGDWLSALIELEARRPSDGQPIRLIGQVMLRFEGDKVAEAYNSLDFLGLFLQLGLLPKDALELGMTGQRLV
ncbi:nuclear transport factor 2 family protein [Rhodovulum visakhapatnamense]|uniref:SnoaL-like polyketide cyclase n=1 Tax=Rhodovulum visakhapatnamense TaxID=364297 RepID=A0A4R8GBF9_9RHOB|nr:nuclear transport factor 2 family protein [Rhodovulum visakhapatnamense]TDX33918.1 SnoaL-like polyketide cyclase [Rhodovulum visakhapatnamense]